MVPNLGTKQLNIFRQCTFSALAFIKSKNNPQSSEYIFHKRTNRVYVITMSAPYAILSQNRVGGGGTYYRISHASVSTKTPMTFGLFVPSRYVTNITEKSDNKTNVPVIFWLSGLTCDDTNFAQKAGARAFLAGEKEGVAIVMPDTSPRGDNSVPNVDSYDLGIGAGAY